MTRRSGWQPVVKVPLHSTGAASGLAALLVVQIRPGILTPRALPARRITGLGAARHFRHGLLGDAPDLDAQRPRPRAIELGHQNPLPLPEDDVTAADLQRQAVTEQQRAQV